MNTRESKTATPTEYPYPYPWCCFGTGYQRAVDGGGWFWEKCDDHPEIENATRVYRERQQEQLAIYRKGHADAD